MVEAVSVRKRFGAADVLRGVDLRIPPGSVSCVIGPSGSGKSTFLRCVNRLEKIDSGRLTVDGVPVGYEPHGARFREKWPRDIARERAQIGMVFQRFNLFPHLTALQNVVEAPRGVLREPRHEAEERGAQLLRRVGLGEKLACYPAQLSGGQQQRVAVARALVGDPLILMADEPTGNLDSRNGEAVMELLRDLHRNGATICMVTHDERYSHFAERTIRLFDGRIVEESAEVHAAV
jgi:polar amino acid transport system ATP-binding protein